MVLNHALSLSIYTIQSCKILSLSLLTEDKKREQIIYHSTMGCGSSDTASPVLVDTTSTAATATITTNFTVLAQQVKQTWPDIRKVDKLGAKVFAQ